MVRNKWEFQPHLFVDAFPMTPHQRQERHTTRHDIIYKSQIWNIINMALLMSLANNTPLKTKGCPLKSNGWFSSITEIVPFLGDEFVSFQGKNISLTLQKSQLGRREGYQVPSRLDASNGVVWSLNDFAINTGDLMSYKI